MWVPQYCFSILNQCFTPIRNLPTPLGRARWSPSPSLTEKTDSFDREWNRCSNLYNFKNLKSRNWTTLWLILRDQVKFLKVKICKVGNKSKAGNKSMVKFLFQNHQMSFLIILICMFGHKQDSFHYFKNVQNHGYTSLGNISWKQSFFRNTKIHLKRCFRFTTWLFTMKQYY